MINVIDAYLMAQKTYKEWGKRRHMENNRKINEQ